MSRRFLSPLAAAAALLAAGPALAEPDAPAGAAASATPAAAAPAAAIPAATCESMVKKLDALEARVRQTEAKVAEVTRRRGPTIRPPDSHGESY
jgi:hypothetical protein